MPENKSILIVDDSKVSRMILKSIILDIQPDITIHEAANADEALKLSRNLQFDYFSVDYNMPGIDGLELINQLKETFSNSKFALLTANIQDSTHKKAELAGAKCINKPINEESVNRMLEYFYVN